MTKDRAIERQFVLTQRCIVLSKWFGTPLQAVPVVTRTMLLVVLSKWFLNFRSQRAKGSANPYPALTDRATMPNRVVQGSFETATIKRLYISGGKLFRIVISREPTTVRRVTQLGEFSTNLYVVHRSSIRIEASIPLVPSLKRSPNDLPKRFKFANKAENVFKKKKKKSSGEKRGSSSPWLPNIFCRATVIVNLQSRFAQTNIRYCETIAPFAVPQAKRGFYGDRRWRLLYRVP